MLKLIKNIFLFYLLFFINIIILAKNPVRLKDISFIQGLKENQLMGFGIVTGLMGRGDSKDFKMTKKMVLNLASNFGFNLTEEDIKSKNVAAVMVCATIGSFTRVGDSIDVTISSIGDAKSLAGGVLLQTALRGADNNIYAVAQGKIIAGSKNSGGELTASIPNGAIIEKEVISNFFNGNQLNIILKSPDFTTINLVREQILTLSQNIKVNIKDAGLLEIILSEEEKNNIVDFIAKIENLTVTPDNIAMVIIDKKTGIIVAGGDVIIQDCSVSIPSVQIKVGTKSNERKNNFEISSRSVSELVKILNDVGLETNEIISLLESIHKAGALNAKLIIM